MRVTMLLCDAADEVGGKLFVLGGGWTHLLVPHRPISMALGIVVAVPWTEANKRHPMDVVLLDEDGSTVHVGESEVRMQSKLEIGRPVGVKPGSELNAVMSFTFNGVALGPGGYVWQLSIGGEPKARTPFWVLDPQEA